MCLNSRRCYWAVFGQRRCFTKGVVGIFIIVNIIFIEMDFLQNQILTEPLLRDWKSNFLWAFEPWLSFKATRGYGSCRSILRQFSEGIWRGNGADAAFLRACGLWNASSERTWIASWNVKADSFADILRADWNASLITFTLIHWESLWRGALLRAEIGISKRFFGRDSLFWIIMQKF